jgi:hypothetical protein
MVDPARHGGVDDKSGVERRMGDDVDLRQLLAVIETQQRSIERLVRLVEQREEARSAVEVPADDKRRRPVDWSQISGRQRLLAWQGLAGFVEDLVHRYKLQLAVRACWWQHGDAIDELTALWHIRQVSFGEDADLTSPMRWQETVEDSVDRVRGMLNACGQEHVDVVMPTWMTEANREAFYQAVREDVFGTEPSG